MFDRIPGMVLGVLPLPGYRTDGGIFTGLFSCGFEKIQVPVTVWSDIQSAEDDGRIWMMLYHEAKRNSNRKRWPITRTILIF